MFLGWLAEFKYFFPFCTSVWDFQGRRRSLPAFRLENGISEVALMCWQNVQLIDLRPWATSTDGIPRELGMNAGSGLENSFFSCDQAVENRTWSWDVWALSQSHAYLWLHSPSAESSWILQSTKKTSGLVKCTELDMLTLKPWLSKARAPPHFVLLPHACLAKGMSGEIRFKPCDLLSEHRKGKLQAESRQECSADPSGGLKGNLKLVGWAIKAHQGSSRFYAPAPSVPGWRSCFLLFERGGKIVFLTQRICWSLCSGNSCEQPYPRATALCFLSPAIQTPLRTSDLILNSSWFFPFHSQSGFWFLNDFWGHLLTLWTGKQSCH